MKNKSELSSAFDWLEDLLRGFGIYMLLVFSSIFGIYFGIFLKEKYPFEEAIPKYIIAWAMLLSSPALLFLVLNEFLNKLADNLYLVSKQIIKVIKDRFPWQKKPKAEQSLEQRAEKIFKSIKSPDLRSLAEAYLDNLVKAEEIVKEKKNKK